MLFYINENFIKQHMCLNRVYRLVMSNIVIGKFKVVFKIYINKRVGENVNIQIY